MWYLLHCSHELVCVDVCVWLASWTRRFLGDSRRLELAGHQVPSPAEHPGYQLPTPEDDDERLQAEPPIIQNHRQGAHCHGNAWGIHRGDVPLLAWVHGPLPSGGTGHWVHQSDDILLSSDQRRWQSFLLRVGHASVQDKACHGNLQTTPAGKIITQGRHWRILTIQN